jgi:WD40 repeat protein
MSPRLVSFLHDADEFIITFRAVIELSVPHIYISALPCLRRTSMVAKIFKPMLLNTVTLTVRGAEQQRRILLDLQGHTKVVRSVRFSPDGSCIVSSSDDMTRVWNSMTGEVMKAFKLVAKVSTNSISFSPDSKHIALGSIDNKIKLLDLSTDEDVIELFSLEGHTAEVTSVAFSPDGKRLTSGSKDETVRIWDIKKGKEVLSLKHDYIDSVCFTPSGSHVMSLAWDCIQMWAVKTGDCIWSHYVGIDITSFDLSPDGMHIVAGSGNGRLWLLNCTAEGGVTKERKFEGHTERVRSVVFSPDGAYVASGSDDKTVRVWNFKTEKEAAKPFEGHTSVVLSVHFSPDGTRIVSGAGDNSILVWDAGITIGKGAKPPLKRHTDAVTCVDFSPDGTCIVSGSNDNTMTVWNSKTGEAIMKRHSTGVSSVQFSPNGSSIVSGSSDGCVSVWDSKTGEEIMTLRRITGSPALVAISCVGFSSDGTRIFAGSWDGSLYLWDTNTGKDVTKLSDKNLTVRVYCAAFSPDGTFIVSGSRFELDGSMLSLWDVGSGERVMSGSFRGHASGVHSLRFSPDGRRIISGSWDNTIRIWDVSTGEEVMRIFAANMSNSICVSPDGGCIVSGSMDGRVRLWDAKTGKAFTKDLEGHTPIVRSVGFSPDGSRVVTCSEDKTIRVWDVGLVERVTTVLSTYSAVQNNRAATIFNSQRTLLPPKVNGWITGRGGELILRVPPEYRSYLIWPPCTLLIGELQVAVDVSHFVHGVEWSKCWSL